MKTLLTILIIITTFLTPIQGLLIMMIIFILGDTFFGIYVSVKLSGLTSFKSTKLFNIVVKSFFYLFSIIMCYFIDKYIFDGELMGIKLLFAKVMTAFWIYIEVKSLDETSMKMGNRSFWIVFKEFINKMKGLKKDLNELIEDKKSDSKDKDPSEPTTSE
jgi:hypothetical protein